MEYAINNWTLSIRNLPTSIEQIYKYILSYLLKIDISVIALNTFCGDL